MGQLTIKVTGYVSCAEGGGGKVAATQLEEDLRRDWVSAPGSSQDVSIQPDWKLKPGLQSLQSLQRRLEYVERLKVQLDPLLCSSLCGQKDGLQEEVQGEVGLGVRWVGHDGLPLLPCRHIRLNHHRPVTQRGGQLQSNIDKVDSSKD